MSTPASLPALCADQRARWQRGEPVRVEDYVARHPELLADTEQLLDLIYQEVVLREEAGESPRLDEYLQRFGSLAESLRPIFEVHEAIVKLAPSATALLPNLQVEPPSPPSLPKAALPALPGYNVLAELGRGGSGTVYKARHLGLDRLVALKVLALPAVVSFARAARFRAEALLAARLQHPNIVQVFEAGAFEGRPFFAMEYVPGGSLAERLAGTPQSPTMSARLVATLARAVHYAHSHGIIHRDLKPGNVLLQTDSATEGLPGSLSSARPRIADFGLAKDLQSSSDASRTGDVLGTPSYMAPEQARGQVREIGPATDVYALGAILYECLTGRPPFKGESAVVTLREVLDEEPVPPSRLCGRTPRDLETICLKCLHKEPRKRYASAAALADDLGCFLDGRPIQARPVSARERVVKWVRRRPALAGLFAVVTVAVLALGLTWYRAARHERQRMATARAEVHTQLSEGQRAFGRGDWAEARSRADAALTRARSESALGELRRAAEDLRGEAERRLEAEAARLQFHRQRDAALFHGMNALSGESFLTGMDAATHRRAAEKAARAALALAGVDLASAAPAGRPEQAADCVAVLFVLAEAVAGTGQDPAQLREALRLVERAGKLQPPTPAYHRQRARYLGRLGQADAASAEVHRAAAGASGALDHFLDGQDHFQRGDLRRASAAFERAVAAEPGHFWAHCYLAVCCLRSGRPGEARAALTVCVDRKPEFVWGWLLRGYAFRELGAFTAAERDFRRAEALLARQPNDEARYALLVNRGVLHFREEEAATATLTAAAGLSGLPNPCLAVLLGRPAGGPLAHAAADLEEATRLRPRQYAPLLNLARVYQRQGRPADAQRAFQRAAELAPPPVLADLRAERARVLLGQGRSVEAEQLCRNALAGRPDHPAALLTLGRALVLLGRDEQAVAAFDRYLATGAPEATDLFRGRGLARLRLGRLAGARDDFARALAGGPDAELHLQRGWAYFFLDAWQPALLDFDESLRLAPGRPDAYTGRALCRVQLGRYREAAGDAEEALRHQPLSAETYHNAACTFALAYARVQADAMAKDRAALAAGYRQQALDLVRRTLAAVPPAQQGAFWRDKISPDRALDAIRQTAEFRSWEATFRLAPAAPK
jgi:tetratricopeptide (TPR) repeat protein